MDLVICQGMASFGLINFLDSRILGKLGGDEKNRKIPCTSKVALQLVEEFRKRLREAIMADPTRPVTQKFFQTLTEKEVS